MAMEAAASSSSSPEERLRFETELEFVQALANPEYLHHLAQNRYFDDPQFVDYVDYLQYWREMPYCQYLAFPHCLRMLELLQTDSFIAALKRADFKDYLKDQQFWSWHQRAITKVPAEPAGGGGGCAGPEDDDARGGGVAEETR